MKEFIDKLISRLEEEKKGQEYLFGNSRGNVNQKSIHKYALQCYELTISIVTELAEEYNKKQEHVVWLNGCDDDTVFTMEMTNNEYEFLKRVSELANETSTYGCMPRMFVDEEGE